MASAVTGKAHRLATPGTAPRRVVASPEYPQWLVLLVTGPTEGRSVVRRYIGSPAFPGPSAGGARCSSVLFQRLPPSPCPWAVREALPHDGRTTIRQTRDGMTFRPGARP
jgi:hypothetical protein